VDELKDSSYAAAGVDVKAGEKAVDSIREIVKTTYNGKVLSELGSFGGLYSLDKSLYQEPVLVSSTDGVGTKLRVAIMAKRYDTIGRDLVNHCVNDILVQGATPLFFLDYIGMGAMDAEKVRDLITGMADACKMNGCALIGGEMAEMPGIYTGRDFDLVGTIVGIVERQDLLPGNRVRSGDVLVGLPSSGLHTNGYSLARKIIFEDLGLGLDTHIPDCSASVGELLLAVHRSYLDTLLPFIGNHRLHGLAHITGGGIVGNLKRIIPEGLTAYVSYSESEFPPLFSWLQKAGKVALNEMRLAFNLGIGLIAVVDENLLQSFVDSTGGTVLGEVSQSREFDDKVRFV
jgi:phosphoribosylformylglycinamidine cyclo-ligase